LYEWATRTRRSNRPEFPAVSNVDTRCTQRCSTSDVIGIRQGAQCQLHTSALVGRTNQFQARQRLLALARKEPQLPIRRSVPAFLGSPVLHTAMTAIPVLFLSVSLLIAVTALVRERRLRRALQILLARLLSRWRQHGSKTDPKPRADSSDS